MEEMENLWQAMKGNHYQRVLEQLKKTIRQTGVLQNALVAALEAVVNAIHAETGTLWFYDRFETGRIHPRAVFGGSDLSGISLAPGEGIAGKVIEKGCSEIIKDCQKDDRWAGRVDEKTGFRTLSMICVPLSLDEHTFGSIQVINNKNGQLFDDKDLAFVERLAGEIALLLKSNGLLDEYLSSAPKEIINLTELTFRELILEGRAKDIEAKISKLPEYAALYRREQQDILQLCKKMHDCFAKHRR